MATSAISAIYDALYNMDVTVNDTTPTPYALTGTPNKGNSADTPMRLLLAVDGSGDGKSIDFKTLGTPGVNDTIEMTWALTDLMLWKPMAQGQGVRSVASDLIAYAAAYVNAIRTNRNLTTRASVVNLRITPGVFEYPAGSGSYYYGVQSVLTILEIVS